MMSLYPCDTKQMNKAGSWPGMGCSSFCCKNFITVIEINENLHEQLLQVDNEIRFLQENVKDSRREAEKAQKQVDKYQKLRL